MNGPLRLLHLEDDPDYCDLVRSLLTHEGFQVESVLAHDRLGFEAVLAPEKFDVILADYLLPSYNGIEALRLAREKCPETPFLLVSGTIGEKVAIDSLKAGATDYVLKHWPERLAPAVRRAVDEARERARRRRIESELVCREKYFRALTENALDIVSLLDGQGGFIYNSPSVKRLLGYEPHELAGQSALALIHPEDLPDVLGGFKRGLSDPDRTITLEFRFRHKDGSWRALEAVGQSRLADPEIGGVVVNSRDIADRKLAEAALRSSEMLFHSVWENSGDGMRLTDEKGYIIAVNDAFCRLVGMRREELEGNVFTVIYADSEHSEKFLQEFRQRFADRVIDYQSERRFTLRNGSVVTLEDTSSFVDMRGQPPLLLGLFRDVTAQKRLEEQLRQSQKMEAIGQLAGGVAHDFNNILTVIHGHASLLMADGSLAGVFARSAQQISQAAERAAALTRQLLTFSRRHFMQPRRLDMNEVVGNITKMLARILGEDIALQLSCFPQPVPVQADAGMMEQVLLNLAVNSRDAMPKGGVLAIKISELELSARRPTKHSEAHFGRFVCLTVADTGCGIAPENLRRVFEPFFTTKEVGKGTGLGLATVYGIVKQHRGWIEVESELGKGTAFTVFLPRTDEIAEAARHPLAAKTARGGTETILVVEDEALVRELVCDLLAGYGYRILQAESGQKALQLWQERKEQIDLLLTDLVMPDRLNGRELAEKLWAERPRLKVIFTSGYGADVVGKDFMARRGLKYLQKPYDPHKLALAVRDCLDAVS